MNQVKPGRKDQGKIESKKEAEKAFDSLFYDPPKIKGVPMATKLDELQQQIAKLQKEHDDLLETQKEDAIEQINVMVKTYGIKAIDIDFGQRTLAKAIQRSTAKVEAKYKSGNEVWSGRGRKPKWVEDHLTKGGKLDDLLIKK